MSSTKKSIHFNRTTSGNYHFHNDDNNKYLIHFKFNTPRNEYQYFRQVEVMVERMLLTTKSLERIGAGTTTFDKISQSFKNSPPRAFEVYQYCYFKIFEFVNKLGNECYETQNIKNGNKTIAFLTDKLTEDIKNDSVDITLLVQAIGQVYSTLNSLIKQDENS